MNRFDCIGLGLVIGSLVVMIGFITVTLNDFGWQDGAQTHLYGARTADSALSAWRELTLANEIYVNHGSDVLVEFVVRADSITCNPDVCEQSRDMFELQIELNELPSIYNELMMLPLAFLMFIPLILGLVIGTKWGEC